MMKKTILLIHGPNLNKLGMRDVEHYGSVTLADIEKRVQEGATEKGYEVETFQSNHEGALIDFLQEHAKNAAGIIINPGALTHYSYALHDALLDTKLPCVEVHLSDIASRDEWRRHSVTAAACTHQVAGKKEAGYSEALEMLHQKLSV